MTHLKFPSSVGLAHRDDALAVVTGGAFHLNRWFGPPSLASMRALGGVLRTFVPQVAGGKTVGLTVVDNTVPLWIDEPTRREGGELQAYMAQHNVAMAHVVLGSGFKMSAARSIAAGLHMVGRRRHPSEIFASFEEAAPWMLKQLESIPEVTFNMAEARTCLDRMIEASGQT